MTNPSKAKGIGPVVLPRSVPQSSGVTRVKWWRGWGRSFARPNPRRRNPAPNDCYAKAELDEPMFTLLARDPFASHLVRRWAEVREAERGPSDKVTEAHACADAMDEWRLARHPEEGNE